MQGFQYGKKLKRVIYTALTAVIIAMQAAGCAVVAEDTPAVSQKPLYSSYLDIPGVTEEEIEAIEALRQSRSEFIYAQDKGTESFYQDDGSVGGFISLVCDWLSELFDIPFTPAIHSWDELISGLETREIDFTGDLTPTTTRRQTYFMTSPIAVRSIKVMWLADNLSPVEISHIRPPRYIFLDGTITYSQIVSYLDEPYEIGFVDSHQHAYEVLKSGDADALFEEAPAEAAFDTLGPIIAEDFFPLVYAPVSLATHNPQLEPIISVVQKALNDGANLYLTELYNQGYRQYLQHKFFSQLTVEEQAYLAAHKESGASIPIGLEYDNYPVSFYNTQERAWQGIAPELLSEIEKVTGLHFEIAHEGLVSFSDLLYMLENGEIAVLSEVIPTIERQDRFLWPEAYATSNYALISLMSYRDVDLNEIHNLRVGLQKNTAYAETFRQSFPGHSYTVEYDDAMTALDALERGDIDLFMATMGHLISATNYLEKPGFKANVIFNRVYESTFGVNLNEPELHSIISKAQRLIDTKTINDRWTTRVFDYRSAAVRDRMPILISAVIFLGVSLLFVLMYYRSKRLNVSLEAAVAERTLELKEQRDIAVAASKSKSNFLATMSHEIRTPLNAILGITQIQIQKENLPKDYEETFKKINNAGNVLLGIINDILDMSKIEAGKLELNPSGYNVAALISDTAQLNIVRIGIKPVKFILDVDENLPLKLYGDELRLKQILNNLLSNAVKYTDSGYVKLSVAIAGDSDIDKPYPPESDVIVQFIVEDTGQGMKPEDCEKLFAKEYQRFNAEANRTTEGTGLGLSIVKSLVEMMDGTINAESEYGKGSTFTLTVKQKASGGDSIGTYIAEQLSSFTYVNGLASSEQQVKRTPMPYGSVLIVDDSESNLFVAEGLLVPYGLKIETASSGKFALKRIEKGTKYDIIFMDHMMPEMDGIETTRKLRELGYTGTIVALTANALAGNSDMFAQNGFDGFISKPIDIQRLDEVLNEFIRDKHPEIAAQTDNTAVGVGLHTRPQESSATINPKLLQVFCREASKAIVTLRETAENDNTELFTTTVHAMKSALANIGEHELSTQAATLEKAGLREDTDYITANAAGFTEALEALIEKLQSAASAPNTGDASESLNEDTAFLTEQLSIIKTACEDFDDAAALTSLDRLQEKQWNPETEAVLEQIRDAIYLDSDFDRAAALAEEVK